jgi:hypothetical protein
VLQSRHHVLADSPCTVLVPAGDGFTRLAEEAPAVGTKIVLEVANSNRHQLRRATGALADAAANS